MRTSEINRALHLPQLTYGVSPVALGICWGPFALIAILVGTSFGWWWALIPVGGAFFTHTILRWFYKKDHRIFDIYGKYALLATHYQPHSRDKLPSPFERPEKFGRGVRI